MVEKKNPDYTASAVNLVNPVGVQEMYRTFQINRKAQAEAAAKIEASIPADLRLERLCLEAKGDEIMKQLRELIDTQGSFQNIEAGEYAVKQAKHTVSYEPSLVRDNLSDQYANMVIIEAVDAVKLKGLVTGGFIDQSVADRCGIAKISYAFIIK